MGTVIRTVRPEEFDSLMDFLERCYGHSRGLFTREYPQLYRPEEEFCRHFHVIEEDGRIVAHVGVFPMTVLSEGTSIPLAGVGGVATLPHSRGRGHMSSLLSYALRLMREQDFPISGLGGDRHRYNNFGWEWSGLVYSLRFTTRSMTKAGVIPAQVDEVRPDKALAVLERHWRSSPCRVDRPSLALLLSKQQLRFWIGEEGYVVGAGVNRSSHNFIEVASECGAEPELIRGAMEWLYAAEARISISPWNNGQLARLMRCAAEWGAGPDWCYRIVNLPALLRAFEPFLRKKAEAVSDFECEIHMRDQYFPNVGSIAVRKGRLSLGPESVPKKRIELDPVSAARLFLGGPSPGALDIPEGLHMLLPLPIHVSPLDYV